MRTGRLKILRRCKELIRELGLYHFDPDKTLSIDKPVKEDDHACDALRYLCQGISKGREPHGMKRSLEEGESDRGASEERREEVQRLQERLWQDELKRLQREHLWNEGWVGH